MGRHFDTLTKDDKVHLLQWFWASVWIYYSSLCFAKVSILLQYLRVFPQNSFRKACFVLMGIIIAYSVATFLTSVFACVPVDSIWNPSIEHTCVNLKALWYGQSPSVTQRRLPLILISRFTNAGINIVTDIGTGVLPLPVLHSLDLPRRRKYALMAVFALGGLYVVQRQSLSPDLVPTNNVQDLHHIYPPPAINIRRLYIAGHHMGQSAPRNMEQLRV
jgi:hypothetical protein